MKKFLPLGLALVLCLSLCACGGSGDATAEATPLAIVKPTASCDSLKSLDLTDVGGVGSTISSATEGTTTINGGRQVLHRRGHLGARGRLPRAPARRQLDPARAGSRLW